jgi:ABC-2 type transport system ATP-binding protein
MDSASVRSAASALIVELSVAMHGGRSPGLKKRAEGFRQKPVSRDDDPPGLWRGGAFGLAMTTTVIDTHRLTKAYGRAEAVRDLTISLPPRCVVGLLGPNGAGKTTLLRMLLGLSRPTSGSARVLGEPIERPERYLARVGAVLDAPSFHPAVPARRALRSLAALGALDEARVDEVLRFVGLRARAEERVGAFSLGMRQRLALAAALLPDPELLILDEPTNGLDPVGIHELRGLVRQLADEGCSIVVSSHLVHEVERTCDHIVVLRGGRLAFAGRCGDLATTRGGSIEAAVLGLLQGVPA